METVIYVDFNTLLADPQERVAINTVVQPDLTASLRPGARVILADETLEVAATVEFDAEHREWYGIPDWSTSRDLDYPTTHPRGATGRSVASAD